MYTGFPQRKPVYSKRSPGPAKGSSYKSAKLCRQHDWFIIDNTVGYL